VRSGILSHAYRLPKSTEIRWHLGIYIIKYIHNGDPPPHRELVVQPNAVIYCNSLPATHKLKPTKPRGQNIDTRVTQRTGCHKPLSATNGCSGAHLPISVTQSTVSPPTIGRPQIDERHEQAIIGSSPSIDLTENWPWTHINTLEKRSTYMNIWLTDI
jgi:hypothetical protein